jgi:hypothetical protein
MWVLLVLLPPLCSVACSEHITVEIHNATDRPLIVYPGPMNPPIWQLTPGEARVTTPLSGTGAGVGIRVWAYADRGDAPWPAQYTRAENDRFLEYLQGVELLFCREELYSRPGRYRIDIVEGETSCDLYDYRR